MECDDGRIGGGGLGGDGGGSAGIERILERVDVAGEHERYTEWRATRDLDGGE
jgi:hypothetical protein